MIRFVPLMRQKQKPSQASEPQNRKPLLGTLPPILNFCFIYTLLYHLTQFTSSNSCCRLHKLLI
jgi:hypothetical protein